MSPVSETRAAELLCVQEPQTIASLTTYVRAAAARPRMRPTLAGLSGGLDSAVLASILVRGLGVERVRLLYLYDRASSPDLRRNANAVAHWLGVPLEEVSIEEAMRAAGVNSSTVMRLTSLSGGLNRFLYRAYGAVAGESAFVSSLRAGDLALGVAHAEVAVGSVDDSMVRIRGPVHRRLALQAEASFAARHRERRRLLEAEAAADDRLPLGAANRSEWLTGWFVVGGIDDLATQPLKGLYKTQVRQLAAVLGVPAHVRSATPSPDMMKGITDETALGLSYPTIDLALDVLAGGISGEQAAAAGLTAEELRRVGQWTALAAWKRTPPAQPGRLPEPERSDLPPVDGGPTGGLRVMPATPP